jgi:hypothetical protein
MQKSTLLSLLSIPILAMAAVKMNGCVMANNSGDTTQRPGRESSGSTQFIRASSPSQQHNDSKFQPEISDRERRMNESTMNRVEHAFEASKLQPSGFGKNGAFLLNKYQRLFDEWGLNESQREDFVGVLNQESVKMAEVSLSSSISWPREVGHVANKKLNAEHTKKMVAEYEKIRTETNRLLTAIVGKERATEFQTQRMKMPQGSND